MISSPTFHSPQIEAKYRYYLRKSLASEIFKTPEHLAFRNPSFYNSADDDLATNISPVIVSPEYKNSSFVRATSDQKEQKTPLEKIQRSWVVHGSTEECSVRRSAKSQKLV
jgi:hypothetical protein